MKVVKSLVVFFSTAYGFHLPGSQNKFLMKESTKLEPPATTVRTTVANLVVGGILLAGVMHPILPVNAEVLTKKDLEGLERRFENRFDKQENMFVVVPLLSAAISGTAAVYSANKLDSALSRFEEQEDRIKKNLNEGIENKAFVSGQRGAFTALVGLAAIMIFLSQAHK